MMRSIKLELVLRELINTLPKCDKCTNPATKANGRGGARWCDICAPVNTPDYPRATALRKATKMIVR